MEKPTVLFIDDDSCLQTLASAMLASRFHILTALNTEEADQFLRRTRVDLIVCDVMMPKEDGVTFCKRLKAGGNSVPFLFLTACGDPASIQKGMTSGANEYLVKPFDVKELERRIVKLLPKPKVKPAAPKSASSTFPIRWFRASA